MAALGNHILVEFFSCDSEVLNDVIAIEQAMVSAAEDAGATVINSTFHYFSPWGVSGVVVIQESHLAIHTWPEYQYAAVDLFTCGDSVDPWISFDLLKKAFKAGNSSALELRRGNLKMLERSDFNIHASREEVAARYREGQIERDVWFTDKDDSQALSLRHTGELLFREKSPYQTVQILDTYRYGKMLTIDSMVMTTEKDEFHYHEMIAHPALLSHPNIKNVLVIGGGDGGTVREVLKHDVDHVTMVEIDAAVIKASKEHLPTISAAFDDPKLELIIGDGIDFVAKAASNTYDLIIVDGSDPVGPAEGLFSEKFYQTCYDALTRDGILVTQGESPKFNQPVFVELNHCLKQVFGANDRVAVSLFYAPTYPSGMWSFQIGSKGQYTPQTTFDAAKAEAFTEQEQLKYYNASIHQASFALPGFVKQMLNPIPQTA